MKNLWREGEMSSSLYMMSARVAGPMANDVILQLIVAVVERHRCWVLAGLDDLGPHELPHEFSEQSPHFVPKIPNSGFIFLKVQN